MLASQAAIAVTNARLYEQAGRRSRRRWPARPTRSGGCSTSTDGCSRRSTRRSVLELIADGLKSVVWYDNLGVYRVDDAG